MGLFDGAYEFARKIPEIAEKAGLAAIRDWEKYSKQVTERIFKEEVEDFYSSYSPAVYSRRHSMMNILDIELTDESFAIDFKEDEMTFSHGGGLGLYDLVFKEGYHGGARSGDYTTVMDSGWQESRKIYTPHPEPGTPYWRQPVPYYTRWGAPAAKSDAPYDKIKERLEFYDAGEGYEYFAERYKYYINTYISDALRAYGI